MKLYAVTITKKAYVLVEYEGQVRQLESEIRRYEQEDFEYYETYSNTLDWPSECLVYHLDNKDITLREALNIVNNKQEKN